MYAAVLARSAAARRRAHKREALLEATENNLEKVRSAVAAGRLKGQDQIGVRVGRVVNQYKVAKHFTLDTALIRWPKVVVHYENPASNSIFS